MIKTLNSFTQFQDFFRKSDVNNSGDIDKAEFINYLQEHEQQLHIVFSNLDENKDGKKSRTDLLLKERNISCSHS